MPRKTELKMKRIEVRPFRSFSFFCTSINVRFTPRADIDSQTANVRYVSKDGVIGRRSCG
jgi:hypothetical protein